ncbi:hypothetical protein [Micromonospora sp. bgisy143]|uniref:hypothetical protein n=1 Tax=Micromonospora sp. bgisy143 TaxID=3413790 RepID=UPI003EBE171F
MTARRAGRPPLNTLDRHHEERRATGDGRRAIRTPRATRPGTPGRPATKRPGNGNGDDGDGDGDGNGNGDGDGDGNGNGDNPGERDAGESSR